MPAQDQVLPKPKKVKVTAKATPKKTRVRVTVPDAGEATRSRTVATSTPDQADRERTPVQKTHDKAVVTRTVKAQRVKVLRKKNAGSWTRGLSKWATRNVHDFKQGVAGGVPLPERSKGPGAFAVVRAQPLPSKVLKNAVADTKELAVTTPSSIAHLAVTAATKPQKLPGELAGPYVNLARNWGKEATEHPVSTALMVQPIVKLPGRAVGRVARKTGAQTLARTAAQLPGTALKEARTGSRDATVRKLQAKKDAGSSEPPQVTAKDVQRRVDEHYDAVKQEAHRIQAAHVKAAKTATKGQPKDVRAAAIGAAREHARTVADEVAQERFIREFGANVRLQHGAGVREATHKVRRTAVAKLDAAKVTGKAAAAAHDAAWQGLRAARTAVRNLPQIRTLEFHRRDSMRDLADAQREASKAREGLAKATGRAQVLTQNVTGRATPKPGGQWAGGGHGVTQAKALVDATSQAVRDVRARIADLDQRIADEHARPLPPLHPARQAFTQAIAARGQARVALAQAKADAHAAAHAHIQAKQAMTHSGLTSPASEGRAFSHRADAAAVARKLNDHGIQLEAGSHAPVRYQVAEDGSVRLGRTHGNPTAPLTFVVRQVGPDKWAAVPKVAADRLTQHHVVGSSPATMAKVMRVSRGAFTQATLPLSAKWLAGQGAEAGVRAVIAGAGPMDWLRAGKVVKKLNDHKPGLGDEFMDRITGGHFNLTGPARDFAGGKSLAEEFKDTPLAQPAAMLTHAGSAAPLKAVRHGWNQYTSAVLGTINHVIESNARRAMAGQAIKNLGFQDSHILGLTDRALEDAARGLKETHNQVALGRAVDEMYGKYQKFSPEMRSLLLHWSPYIAWTLNTIKFLTKTLPVDHPVKAALLADATEAERDWRVAHGLSINDAAHIPSFMLGGYPVGTGGKILNVAHYTPWGMGADPVSAASSLVLPQFIGPLGNTVFGVDWKGDTLTEGGAHGPKFTPPEKLLRAAVTVLESQVPGVTQAGKISGVTPRYVDHNSPESIKSAGDVLKSYLPWTPTTPGSQGTGGGGSAAPTPGRVKVPGGAGGRVKIPGVTGRVKVP